MFYRSISAQAADSFRHLGNGYYSPDWEFVSIEEEAGRIELGRMFDFFDIIQLRDKKTGEIYSFKAIQDMKFGQVKGVPVNRAVIVESVVKKIMSSFEDDFTDAEVAELLASTGVEANVFNMDLFRSVYDEVQRKVSSFLDKKIVESKTSVHELA